jgi:hypothetical protein
LLTHAVSLDDPAAVTSDRVAFLGEALDHTGIPLLCRTSYGVRMTSSTVELLEEGATFVVTPTVDDAIVALDLRIRRRVLDVAARSGWLPLGAGLAVIGDRAWLVAGAAPADRARLLEQLVRRGALPGTAEVALVRSGRAVGYPRPVWVPAEAGSVSSSPAGPVRLRTPDGEVLAVGTVGDAPVRPRSLTGIVLLADDPSAVEAQRAQAATGALLAARIGTGVRQPSTDVAEIAGVLREVGEVVVVGRSPATWSTVLSRITAG